MHVYRCMRLKKGSEDKWALHHSIRRYRPYIEPKELLPRLSSLHPPTIDLMQLLADKEHPFHKVVNIRMGERTDFDVLQGEVEQALDGIIRRALQRQTYTVMDSPNTIALIGVFYDSEYNKLRFGILTVYTFIEIIHPPEYQRFFDKALEHASAYLKVR